jgi:hypothetical protein
LPLGTLDQFELVDLGALAERRPADPLGETVLEPGVGGFCGGGRGGHRGGGFLERRECGNAAVEGKIVVWRSVSNGFSWDGGRLEVGAGAKVTLDVGVGERPLPALVVDPAGDINQGVSLTATEAAFAAYG